MTIPASQIVTVVPGVLSAGGSALVMNGLLLSNDAATPIGSVLNFTTAAAVSSYFGAASPEATVANIYFNGYDNATALPGSLLVAQYPSLAVGGWLRGGSVAALTLTQLQALTGTLSITVGGVVKTSTSINLSAATSFSNAAALILAAFTTPGFTCVYDGQRGAFLFTNTTMGTAGSMSYATGTLAAGLLLTQSAGATLSAGSAAAVPATFMEGVATVTQNWVDFMSTFEPVLADKLAFAAWVVSKTNRFAYICWDTDVNASVANNQTAFGPLVLASASSGVVPVYQSMSHAAMLLGITASIDFTRTNGRITYAFKHLAGQVASVTDATIAANLIANGYNFYGSYATANQLFTDIYPGQVAGQYLWLDAYINQIWLNNALQLAMMSLLNSVPSIPYNPAGYLLIDAACMDPINAAVNFGAIRNNVPLSASQAAQVNNAAGIKIDDVLASRGWYLQIKPATAQVRSARQSPPMTLWYMDGGAVHKLNLASILVQ